MTLEDFKSTLLLPDPPVHVNSLLTALWHDARGDWNAAHNIAQDIHSREGSWIHAYLHRKEGDAGNAAYWYSKAGRKVSSLTLEQEWDELVTAFLIDKGAY